MFNMFYYPRDTMLARVFATAKSPSDQYCVKTKKASVMISSPSGSPTLLVFRCQVSEQCFYVHTNTVLVIRETVFTGQKTQPTVSKY